MMIFEPGMKLMVWLIACLCLSGCERSAKKERTRALTDVNLEKLKTLDVALGKPKPGDWLDVHKEPGQPFETYIKSNPVSTNARQNKIYLQPWGTFTATQKAMLEHTADYLTIFFGLETVMLPTKSDDNIPASARREHQLLTTYLLDILQANIPDDAIVVMAITSADLYPNKNFNFVFGQARLKQRVGVSSIYRLESSDPRLGLMRLIKTGSHEIGHMFSCQHCTYAECVMNGSNSLPEADSRPNRLCYDCHRKLFWNLGFDVKRRVVNLNNFFVKHDLKNDYDVALKDRKALGF